MGEKKTNIILVGILVILMIIAIAIVIINPNKTEKTVETYKESVESNSKNEQIQKDLETENKIEEQKISMQVGGTFCKLENKIVFYEDTNKSIYFHNLDDGTTKKLATIRAGANKIYFDGEYIYSIPYYHQGKGIYKIDLEGKVETIYKGASLQLWIREDKIYFVNQVGFDDFNQNPQGTICVMNKDGSNVVELAKSVKNNFYIQNDKIYYTTQDRKMYQINLDGTNEVSLVDGRKFVIATLNGYVLYIDYANQEAEHILNVETKEDNIIGHFGQLLEYQGRIYLNARKKLEDGALSDKYTLFEIEEFGKVKEIGQIADFSSQIKYIINDKAYIYNQQDGIYTINLKNNQKDKANEYEECKFFLGGYGYKLNDSEVEEIKIERIEL